MNSKPLVVNSSLPFEIKNLSDQKSEMTFKGFTAGGSKLGVSSSTGIAIGLTNSEHAVADQPRSLELRIATSMEKTHEKQPQQYQECDRVLLSESSNC